MEKFDYAYIALQNRVRSTWESFRTDENGDTNFVSIILILAMVLILAAGLYGLVSDSLSDILNNASGFFKSVTSGASSATSSYTQ